MRALYEIDQDILSCLDMETGEIMDMERLGELQMERSAKIENVACFIKNLENDAAGLKAQKDAFAEREQTVKNKIASLKRWLVEACAGEKFASERCEVRFRRSELVYVENVDSLPDEFLRQKTTVEPDKEALKKALKAGAVIAGCELKSNVSATVK